MTISWFLAGILLAQGGDGVAQRSPGLPWWLPLVFIGFLFYFILWRPEQRRRAEFNKMISSLKKNDRVLVGGIFGTVVNAPQGSEDVTVRIDDSSNIRVRVLRSAISRVISSDDDGNGSAKET